MVAGGSLVADGPAGWGRVYPAGSASNFGGTVNVNVGGVSGFQGLFQFDLSKLPSGTTAANVLAASLRLYVNKVGTAGSINVNVATSSWTNPLLRACQE